MFTGIIEEVGKIQSLRGEGGRLILSIRASLAAELALGESVAVEGACLTVVKQGREMFEAEVSGETADRTTLSGLTPGRSVNLERALRLGDRLSGHLVQGHVDGLALVKSLQQAKGSLELWLVLPQELMPYIVPKGSLTVSGVSLTVNELTGPQARLNLVPYSVGGTNLSGLRGGERVNVETDLIGKYVARFLGLGASEGGVTMELLGKQGYL